MVGGCGGEMRRGGGCEARGQCVRGTWQSQLQSSSLAVSSYGLVAATVGDVALLGARFGAVHSPDEHAAQHHTPVSHRRWPNCAEQCAEPHDRVPAAFFLSAL